MLTGSIWEWRPPCPGIHRQRIYHQPQGRDDFVVAMDYCDRQPEETFDQAVKGVSFMDGRNRSDVARGPDVSVVLKEDQPIHPAFHL